MDTGAWGAIPPHAAAYQAGHVQAETFERDFQRRPPSLRSHRARSTRDSGYGSQHSSQNPGAIIGELQSERSDLKEKLQDKDQTIQRHLQEKNRLQRNHERAQRDLTQAQQDLLQVTADLRTREIECDGLRGRLAQSDRDYTLSVQAMAVLRNRLASELMDSQKFSLAQAVLRESFQAMEAEYTRLVAMGAAAEQITAILAVATEALIQRGQALLGAEEYTAAEACFREAMAFTRSDTRTNWSISPEERSAARLGLCKALAHQNDADKTTEALQIQLTAHSVIVTRARNVSEQAWAFRIVTESPSIYVKQEKYRQAREMLTSIWEHSDGFTATQFLALKDHTITILAAIPPDRCGDRFAILASASDAMVRGSFSEDDKCQMLWRLVQQSYHCDHIDQWRKAKSMLEHLLAVPERNRGSQGPSTPQAKVFMVWLHRRTHAWSDAGEAAVNCLEQYGYDRAMIGGDQPMDYLKILTEVIKELTHLSTKEQTTNAVSQATFNRAFNLFARCVAKVRELGFYPREATLLDLVVDAGQGLKKRLHRLTRESGHAASVTEASRQMTQVKACLRDLGDFVAGLRRSTKADTRYVLGD